MSIVEPSMQADPRVPLGPSPPTRLRSLRSLRASLAELPWLRDPRHFQIASLAALLSWGLFVLGWDVRLLQVALILIGALVTQWVASRLVRVSFEPRSALISALSLCLLLRTNRIELALVAAIISIASKFVIRIDGKHVFNPTNFGLVVMLLLFGDVWVSAGQWGSTALGAFFFMCMGTLVVFRAERSDITIAFLAFNAALMFGRALWLGDPMAIPIHQMKSGALLLFAFFMISDPRTTPDSRTGRILFALVVAVGAYLIRFKLFANNGLLFSLAAAHPAVRLFDRLLPGTRYEWPTMMKKMLIPPTAVLALAIAMPRPAHAMCGCMMQILPPKPTQQQLVAQKILNESSKVAMVRSDDTSIMTMSNDVITDVSEFGLIVPVPTVITKNDVRVVEQSVFTALEQLTNPRLIEKWDPDPCPAPPAEVAMSDAEMAPQAATGGAPMKRMKASDYGVKIEAHYTVGEYSIAVLSAKEGAGAGLMEWLRKFHYAVPEQAVPVLNSYIKQNMRFFVAKVDFRKVDRSKGRVFLRPIQVRYTTPKLMLPVRLGTINADGPQELVAYFISPRGRIESTNYQTVRMPTGQDVPLYVKDQFERMYQAIFASETQKHDMRVVFLEYVERGALPPQTAAQLGLGWGVAKDGQFSHFTTTRLHFKYDRDHFPEDLGLQETADIAPFLVSYNVHHQAENVGCDAGQKYLQTLPPRREKEAESLAMLTKWDAKEIREKMGLPIAKQAQPGDQPEAKKREWWQIWQ